MGCWPSSTPQWQTSTMARQTSQRLTKLEIAISKCANWDSTSSPVAHSFARMVHSISSPWIPNINISVFLFWYSQVLVFCICNCLSKLQTYIQKNFWMHLYVLYDMPVCIFWTYPPALFLIEVGCGHLSEIRLGMNVRLSCIKGMLCLHSLVNLWYLWRDHKWGIKELSVSLNK